MHKVQVVATEAGIYDDLEKSPTIPYHQTPEHVNANPLSHAYPVNAHTHYM